MDNERNATLTVNITLKDIELPNGGCIEAPDEDGHIRIRDEHGNCTDKREPGDSDWQELADHFGVKPEDFAQDDED